MKMLRGSIVRLEYAIFDTVPLTLLITGLLGFRLSKDEERLYSSLMKFISNSRCRILSTWPVFVESLYFIYRYYLTKFERYTS